MIQSIHITNPSGNTLDIILRSSFDDHGLLIFNLTGLGSPKATVSGLSGPTYDGISGEFVRADARHLLLTIAIPVRGDAEETARAKIYEFFPVKEEIFFRVTTGVKDVYTPAIVESVEMNQFSKVENAVISLYCPDPYFLDSDDSEVWAYYKGVAKTIDYIGDWLAGGLITVRFPLSCGDWLTILNSNGSQVMALDFAPIGGPGAIGDGDSIVINSEAGQKSITHYDYDGAPAVNLLSCLDPASDWPNFRPGNNDLTINTDTLGAPHADRPNPSALEICVPLNEFYMADPALEWDIGWAFTTIGGDIKILNGRMYAHARDFRVENEAYLYGHSTVHYSELNPTSNFSINLWIRPTSVATTNRIILSAYEDANNGFEIRHNSSNKIEAAIKVGGTEYAREDTLEVSQGVWTMFTISHQVSPGPYLVLTRNAAVIMTTSCPAAIPSYVSKWSIGGKSGAEYLDARLSMITLHDLDLSDDEKIWLYRGDWGRTYAELSETFEIDCQYRHRYQGV